MNTTDSSLFAHGEDVTALETVLYIQVVSYPGWKPLKREKNQRLRLLEERSCETEERLQFGILHPHSECRRVEE